MDKQKQIEEMVLVVYPWLKEIPIEERKQLSENVSGLMVVERLYNAGYRKIPENAVIVSRQVWEEHIENWNKTTKAVEERVRKETAEKFAEKLENRLDCIDTILHEDNEEEYLSANELGELIDEITKEFTEGEV